MEHDDVYRALRDFVVRELLDGDGAGLDKSTRLLETGILDSMSMVELIAHLETSLGLVIPHNEIVPEHFATLDQVVNLVMRVRRATAPEPGRPR